MDKTWRCVKAIDSAGNEFEVYDHITFEINGSDSTFTRQTDYHNLQPTYILSSNESNVSLDSVTGIMTVSGSWTWGYALNGEQNKQIISRINRTNKAEIENQNETQNEKN